MFAMSTRPYPILDSKLIRVRSVGQTLVYADGPNQDRVVSCQPDGSLDSRDPGTSGAWEVCKMGSFAGYDPDPNAGGPYLFTLTEIPG